MKSGDPYYFGIGAGGAGGGEAIAVYRVIDRDCAMTQVVLGGYAHSISRPINCPPTIENYVCDHCGTIASWRSVDPGPSKCKSCGAPRRLK